MYSSMFNQFIQDFKGATGARGEDNSSVNGFLTGIAFNLSTPSRADLIFTCDAENARGKFMKFCLIKTITYG
jgi:hypothetical protein